MIHRMVASGMLALTFTAPAFADGLIRGSEGIGYYVAVDGRSGTPSGVYAGLPNPNANRLTLLFDHGNHFHGLGAYSYSGPAASPTVNNTSTNNRLPEPYWRTTPERSALSMVAGTGAFSGSWVSSNTGSEVNAEYGYLGIASIQSLSGLSAAADVLFNSSGQRWNASHPDVIVGLKLESISSGLKVAAGGVTDIFAGGDTFSLGALDNFTFLPTFHVAQGAAEGIYSASFTLVNLSAGSPVLNSGVFHYDFAVPAAPVPEPEALALMLAGLGVVAWARARSRQRQG